MGFGASQRNLSPSRSHDLAGATRSRGWPVGLRLRPRPAGWGAGRAEWGLQQAHHSTWDNMVLKKWQLHYYCFITTIKQTVDQTWSRKRNKKYPWLVGKMRDGGSPQKRKEMTSLFLQYTWNRNRSNIRIWSVIHSHSLRVNPPLPQ